jgi:hypothetical protein
MNRFAHRVVAIAAAAVMGTGIALVAPGTASANHEGQPTTRELMDLCNRGRTDSCDFKPSGISTFNGHRQLAGSSTNCTNFNQVRVIRYEASQGTSHSFGVDFSAGSKIGKSFEWSVKTSYNREWTWNDTTVDEIRQDVGPRSRVLIYAAKVRSRVSGTYELRFGSRYKGHYYWYVNGQVEGQTRGQPWDMTAEQVRASC